MKKYIAPLLLALMLLATGYLLYPYLLHNLMWVKSLLITLKKFCLANVWAGYALYAVILSTIILAGLPLATLAMLLAGVIYGFWEAATIITVCRLAAAMIAFGVARQLFHDEDVPIYKKPFLLRKFEKHPSLGLLLARLAPIPDSIVNYTLATSPIRKRDYMLVSLMGMIPFTLFCVWMGRELGNISSFIRYLG